MTRDPLAPVRRAAAAVAAREAQLEKARGTRRDAIVAALAAGFTSREVAEAAGMSHARVLKIASHPR